MNVNRRTQTERTAATRAALITAGRELFGQHGYAGVGTQAIVERAGVTRGALYHQFDDKKGLFGAVYDELEKNVTGRIGVQVIEIAESDPLGALKAGVRAFIEAFTDPSIHQIALVDAPAVLGWSEWRERGEKYGFALIDGLLRAAIDAGQIADQPVRPIAHVAVGALDESALYVAAAQDKDAAIAEVLVVMNRIIDAFRIDGK